MARKARHLCGQSLLPKFISSIYRLTNKQFDLVILSYLLPFIINFYSHYVLPTIYLNLVFDTKK